MWEALRTQKTHILNYDPLVSFRVSDLTSFALKQIIMHVILSITKIRGVRGPELKRY